MVHDVETAQAGHTQSKAHAADTRSIDLSQGGDVNLDYDQKFGVAEESGLWGMGRSIGIMKLIIGLTTVFSNKRARQTSSMQVFFLLSLSFILAGVILLGMCLGGIIPATAAEQKLGGVYTVYWVEYLLFCIFGITGCLGGWLGLKSIKQRSQNLMMLSLLLITGTLTIALATVGMSAWLIHKDSKATAYYAPFVTYIALGMPLLQMVSFIWLGVLCCISLREASPDFQKQGLQDKSGAGTPELPVACCLDIA